MILDCLGRPTQPQRELSTTNPQIAKFVAMADVPFQTLGLTVVCSSCGETPSMANDPTDVRWRMDCSCTTRVVKNPSPSSRQMH